MTAVIVSMDEWWRDDVEDVFDERLVDLRKLERKACRDVVNDGERMILLVGFGLLLLRVDRLT